MRARILLLLFLAAFPALAAKQRSVRFTPAVTAPTFSNEVVRIFQQHCQSCHHEGDIAPFSLMTYAEAKPYATLIKFMTQSRQMPPWKPSDGCGDFVEARKLTTAEIDTIAKWVNAGAPEGNPAQLPTPRDFSAGWILGEPDLVLASPEPYTPAEGKDTYRCFTMPANTIAEKFVRAIDVHPGNRETVHHVISFIDTTGASLLLDEADPGPGYTCFGDAGFNATGTLGGWAPGSRPLELPDKVGFSLPAASRVVLQVHYHPHHGAPGPDQTSIGIYFAEEEPEKLMYVIPLINDTFTIPPHDANYRVEAGVPFIPFPIKIWFIAPHMHLLGRKMNVVLQPPNGAAQCLIDIQDWDFNWQGSYRFQEPVQVPTGSKVSLTAFYDNSSSNPRNPNDPPKAVSWGEQTTDEMCIAFLGITLD
ncbi:MAG TPA: ascorbate-dependent monooxygenase [Thermoanaerobaculia bacterium]|nr:ascorbate-dependent monooxygenase [Thermoanaerobaculia bacterium]